MSASKWGVTTGIGPSVTSGFGQNESLEVLGIKEVVMPLGTNGYPSTAYVVVSSPPSSRFCTRKGLVHAHLGNRVAQIELMNMNRSRRKDGVLFRIRLILS